MRMILWAGTFLAFAAPAQAFDMDCKAPKGMFQEAVCTTPRLKAQYQKSISDALALRLQKAPETERADLTATQAGWLRWQDDHGQLPDPDEKPMRWRDLSKDDKEAFADEYELVIKSRGLALTDPDKAYDFYRERAAIELRLPEEPLPPALRKHLLDTAQPAIDAMKAAIAARTGKEAFPHSLYVSDVLTHDSKALIAVHRQSVSVAGTEDYEAQSSGVLWDVRKGKVISIDEILPIKTKAELRMALAKAIHAETHEYISPESAKLWTVEFIAGLLLDAIWLPAGEPGQKAEGLRAFIRWKNPEKIVEEQEVFIETAHFMNWLLPDFKGEFMVRPAN